MISEIIKNRRSTRVFTNYIVPNQELLEILSAGIMAPSGKNRRPWRFVIIRNKEVIKNIARPVKYSRFIRNVPQMILIYAEVNSSYSFDKDLIGIGACIENILLATTEKNYGGCVIGELYDKQSEIAQHVNVNTDGFKLICGIVIGRSAEFIIDRVPLDVLDYVMGSVE